MDKKSIFQLGCQPILKSFSDSLPVWGNPDLILYHILRIIKFRVDVHFKHGVIGIVQKLYEWSCCLFAKITALSLILFELCLLWYLAQSTFFLDTLYFTTLHCSNNCTKEPQRCCHLLMKTFNHEPRIVSNSYGIINSSLRFYHFDSFKKFWIHHAHLSEHFLTLENT